MSILYLPLDERPCNFDYPQRIAQLQPALHLVVPPLELLSHKKQAAEVDRLWGWLTEHVAPCSIAIISIEMLVYGGLLPSRLHHSTVAHLSAKLDRLCTLKAMYPDLVIFASN
jgi:hypothetical protein